MVLSTMLVDRVLFTMLVDMVLFTMFVDMVLLTMFVDMIVKEVVSCVAHSCQADDVQTGTVTA